MTARQHARLANFILFGVTAAELAILLQQTPSFGFIDWIYISQHLLVLAVAFARLPPRTRDYSVPTSAAVIVSYTYPYAQVAVLGWNPGQAAWPAGGFVLVIVAAALSLTSLLSLGRSFGVRPALRRLVTRGPYTFVRHPMYLSYVISDVGYNLEEWSAASLLLVLLGWTSLLYRIRAEERLLSQDAVWPSYAASVRYRLLPGIW